MIGESGDNIAKTISVLLLLAERRVRTMSLAKQGNKEYAPNAARWKMLGFIKQANNR